MSKTTTVNLKLQLTGQQAINQIKQVNFDIGRSQKQQQQNLGGILQTQNRINQSTQQAGRYSQQQLRSGQSMVQTNRLLAQILQQQQRSGSLISQQLRQQERSYQVQLNHLRQQVAAAERLRQQLQQAGRAQHDLNRGGNGGTGGNVLGSAAAAAGGVYAGGMIVSNALKDPREYVKQVAYATDTAIGTKDVSIADYKNLVNKMDGFVRVASKQGGAAPWETMAGLNTLTASNVFEFDELEKQLLLISKTAFASGADAGDIARMSVAQRNFGLTDLNRSNEMAMRAGQLGSFELRDMARYMPDLLTQGKNSGYIGDQGYQNLLTMMQISMKTAADPSQAATNLSDLLSSFSQYHFGLSMAKHIKVQKGDPIAAYGVGKKKVGFDWTTYAARMQEQGVGQVESAALLVKRQMQTNKLYSEYERKAKEALKNNDKAGYQMQLQSAQNIVGQSEIGRIFHNKQQLSAFTALMMNGGKGGEYERILSGTADSIGAIDISNARHSSMEFGKDGSFDTATFFAKVDSYKNNSDWLGDIKTSAYEWINENEAMAGSMATATTALVALTAAAGVAALATGKMGLGGAAGSATGAAGGLAAGAAAARMLAVGKLALAGALGYGVGTGARSLYMQTESGQKFDNWGGEKIAQILSFFGSSTAKEALEATTKYEEMIAQQEQQAKIAEQQNKLTEKVNLSLNTLIDVTRQNKPAPYAQMTGNIMLDMVSGAINQEGSRHGTVPSSPFNHK